MAEPRARVYVSFDPADQAAALDLIDRLREAEVERVIHLPDADSAIVLARDDHLGNGQDIEGIHYRAQESEFLVVPVVLGGADTSRWPKFLQERQGVNLYEPGGPERVVDALLQPRTGPPPALSPSVEEARRRVVERLGDAVAQYELAVEIARIHPEYGGGLAASLPSGRYAGHFREGSADEWLREVRGLVSERAAPTLHGRAVMLALGLLAPDLRRVYREVGFEDALVGEIREPLDELLTGRGLALWEEREPPPDTDAAPEETVPTHADNPATVDELGREGIARVLAARIRDMRRQERAAFLVHLHARWGMGKTSLLNFLKDELGPGSGDPWIVVEFNAWRHQRIAPPWWWLMTALYQQGSRELRVIDSSRAWWLRFREWRWRGLFGWILLFLVVVGLGLLVWLSGWVGDLWRSDEPFTTLMALVVGAATVVGALVTIWGAARSAGNWFLTASPRTGRAYVHHSRDPMETVQEHFADLVRWLHYPVIILIDDLDRCRGDYVVELLEGIQTLFRDQPVAYVVAADRDWLSDSYQAAYGDFVSANDEPGRPLGYLFLEKTFQLSVTLPPPSTTARAGFWGRLLRPGETVDRGELAAARKAADDAFAGLDSEAAIRRELQAKPDGTAAELQARREAAAIQLASPVVAQEARHALEPFAGLLDPNPRAMKRLVNAYGMARGIETLGGENLEGGRAAQQTTALWTILALRWPRLADYLADHPDQVAAIGDQPPAGAPAELAPLFADREVAAVVAGEGEGIDVQLDEAAIRSCGGQIQV